MAKVITYTNFDYLSQFMSMSKGNDYLTNIPKLTRENITEVGNAIINYQPAKDAFYNAFIVKIKEQLFKGLTADNKFAFLKGRNIDGDIEDSYVDYIEGKNFDPEDDTLLKNVKAKIQTLYHKIDRKLVYETSISDAQLRDAMLSSNGLDTLFGIILQTLYNSNEWDEFTMVKELIVHNLQYAGKVIYLGKPFIKDAEGNDTTQIDYKKLADAMLINVRKMSKDLSYVSRNHNVLELTARTPINEQIFVVHKDMNINIDFASLSNIFNLDKVETATNMIEVDNFNDNEYIVGAIMSKDAFRYRDYLRQTTTFVNPQTLTTKYFHHVQQMISYSYLYNTVYFVIGDEAEVKSKLKLKTKEELLSK